MNRTSQEHRARRNFWVTYAVLVLLILLACSGCETIRQHPRVTAVITGIVVTGAIAAHQHGRDVVGGQIALQPAPNCASRPESCR